MIPAQQSRNQKAFGTGELTAKGAKNAKKISEYLPQRRPGAMVGKAEVNSFEDCNFLLPTLASLRLCVSNIRIRESSPPEYLRKMRELLAIAMQTDSSNWRDSARLCSKASEELGEGEAMASLAQLAIAG